MLNKVVLYNNLLKKMEGHRTAEEIVEYFDNYTASKPSAIADDYDFIKEQLYKNDMNTSVDAIASSEVGSPLYASILETNTGAFPVVWCSAGGMMYAHMLLGDKIETRNISKIKETLEGVEMFGSKYVMEFFNNEDFRTVVEEEFNIVAESLGIAFTQVSPIEIYADSMQTVIVEKGFKLSNLEESKDKRIVVSINEDYRPLFIMNATNTYISEKALLKNCNYRHMNKYREFIVQESVKTNARLAVRTARTAKNSVKNTVVKGVTKALKVPKEIIRRASDFDTRIRRLISNLRNNHDEKLKEKLFNEEFIPIFDDLFAYVIPAIVTYGVIVTTAINPVIAIALGLLGHVLLKYKADKDKKRVISILDDKIKLLDEEIEDAKVENDLVVKKQLMQLKMQLERKRAKIKIYGDIGVMS